MTTFILVVTPRGVYFLLKIYTYIFKSLRSLQNVFLINLKQKETGNTITKSYIQVVPFNSNHACFPRLNLERN